MHVHMACESFPILHVLCSVSICGCRVMVVFFFFSVSNLWVCSGYDAGVM